MIEGAKREFDFKFELGETAKDRITGFQGVVIARSQWLGNCNTYQIKSRQLDKDGKPLEAVAFDEVSLIPVEQEVLPSKRDTGGPTEKVRETNRL